MNCHGQDLGLGGTRDRGGEKRGAATLWLAVDVYGDRLDTVHTPACAGEARTSSGEVVLSASR